MDVDISSWDEKAGKYFMRLCLNICPNKKCFNIATNIRYVNYVVDMISISKYLYCFYVNILYNIYICKVRNNFSSILQCTNCLR